MTEFTEQTELIRCCNCGIVFGALDGWKKLREGDGRHFFCPNGHAQWYTPDESAEVKKLKALREEKTKQLIDIVFQWFSTVEDPAKHEKAATPDEILKRIIEIRELK